MRVFNLTDVATPVLISRELVRAPVRVGGVVIRPGEAANVPNPAGAKELLTIGAISIDELPGWYLEEKAKIPSQRNGSPDPAPDISPTTPEETSEESSPEEPPLAEPEEEPIEEVEETVEEKPERKTRKRRGRK